MIEPVTINGQASYQAKSQPVKLKQHLKLPLFDTFSACRKTQICLYFSHSMFREGLLTE